MYASPLAVESLTKTFGGRSNLWKSLLRRGSESGAGPVKSLDAVSFEVSRREIHGIIGANGSGKSTLVRILSTLLLPDSGRAAVFGFDVVREAMQVRRLINRVSADPSFFRSMSATENLLFFGRIYGLGYAQIKDDSRGILDRLGITRRQGQEPMRNMSRGQQQKVAIARAFLTSPVLMLMDEPTTGLDPRSKRDVQEFIRGIRDQHDATVLITTHDMQEAEALCDRVGVLSDGRLVAEGTPLELRTSVAHGRVLESIDMETVYMELTGRSLEDTEAPKEKVADG